MKSLLKFVIPALCLAMALSACGINDSSVSRDRKDKKEDKEITVSVSDDNQKTGISTEPEIEPAGEPEVENYILYSSELKEIVYMDKEGIPIRCVNTNSLPGTVVTTDNRYVLLTDYVEGSYNARVCYLYDAKEDKVTEFANIEDFDYADIYNGVVYITTHSYSPQNCVTYGYDEETLSLVYEDNNFINDAIDFRFYNPYTSQYYNRKCNERLLEENGFVIVGSSGLLYTYEGNGLVMIDAVSSDYANIVDYNEGYILYIVYDPDSYETIGLFSYNFNTDEILQLTEGYGSVLGLKGDNVIVHQNISGEYGVNEYRVFSMNLFNYEKNVLVEATNKPGVSQYSAGYEGFKMVNGRIYYVADDGVTKDWFCVGEDGKAKALGLHDEQPEWAEFASIDYVSDTAYCEFCGAAIGKYYDEYPTIYKEVSLFYEKINEVLKEKCFAGCDGFMANDVYSSFSEEECEWYGHGSAMGCTTYDGAVSSIYLLGIKYLYIEKNGYWYGGGAHGYPTTSTYIFDIETGNLLTFGDIYEGTEEEFKTLIATKTAEYAQTFDEEDTPFFNPDYNEVYERAYEHASLEHACLWMSHEGLIYYFEPYYLGSYAAGYIMVPLTLEDVELENVLN